MKKLLIQGCNEGEGEKYVILGIIFLYLNRFWKFQSFYLKLQH